LFLLGVGGIFSQGNESDALIEHRYIPEELLRPRREEAPRYPVDTVIGVMGQGKASEEAYEFARRAAAALLAGTPDVPVLATLNTVFLESCMNLLQAVSPHVFRLGSGREEPDGSVSFLVRFIGREQGITGELFIRYEEQRPDPPPASENTPGEDGPEFEEGVGKRENAIIAPIPKKWIFEDLILEEPREREEENRESRHRFDFPPYERFF
jgi:hypothetical protein